MTLPKGRKLILKDVSDNFSNYNFIIYTNAGVIDTSKYQKVNYQNKNSNFEGTAFTQSGLYEGRLLLITGTKDGNVPYTIKQQKPDIYPSTKTGEYLPEANTIYLYEHEVQNIIVKSKRNFLGNQKPIK